VADVAVDGEAQSLVATDFNGDGADDLLVVTAASVDQFLCNADRSASVGTSIVGSAGQPSVGLLASDDSETAANASLPSVALSIGSGLSVFTADSATLTPMNYASVQPTSPKPFAASPYTIDRAGLLPETGFFVYTKSEVFTFTLRSTAQFNGSMAPVNFAFPVADSLVGTGVVRRFANQPCAQMALAFDRALHGHVAVFAPPCPQTSPPTPPTLMTDVALPPLVTLCGVLPNAPPCVPLHSVDVNNDGIPDLLAVASDGNIYVAYSDGRGAFWPDAALSKGPSGTFSKLAAAPGTAGILKGGGRPIALADINGDCLLDVVDTTGVYFGKTTGAASCAPGTATTPSYDAMTVSGPPNDHLWAFAGVGDTSGTHRLDVIVVDASSTGLSILRNTGGMLFDPVPVPTFDPVKALAIADYDGDGIDDIAYAEVGAVPSGKTTTQDSVFISFGTPSGPPGESAFLGYVQGVSQILPNLEEAIYTDVVASPFVTSQVPTSTAPLASVTTGVYLFVGNTSREIVAPFLLFQDIQDTTDEDNIDAPVRTTVGAFNGSSQPPALAVFTHTVRDCLTCASRLWYVPTGGDAAIKPTSLECAADGSVPCPTSLAKYPPFDHAPDALMTTIAQGVSTPAAILATPEPSGGATWLTSAALSGGMFDVLAPAKVAFDITDGMPGTNITGDLSVVNVDGKGADLVLASPTGGIMVLAWPGAGNPFPTSPVIATAIFSDIDAACDGSVQEGGAGNPRMGGALALRAAPWPSTTYVRSQLPTGSPTPQQALVVVTPGGVALLQYDGQGGFHRDSKGYYPCLHDHTGTPLIGGSAIATGDFDGDGIDDIAVSADTGVSIYYGDSYAAGQGRLATDAGAL
jgi:hypothetical protein